MSLYTITGPSGVGKDSLVQALIKREPKVTRVVTTTTRKPRDTEINGKDYHFTDETAFRIAVDAGVMIEHTQVHGNWYGISRLEIDSKLATGKELLVIVDPVGMQLIKAVYPDAVSIFIAPATKDELSWRLQDRGSEDTESYKQRMADANRWLSYINNFDHLLVNESGRMNDAVMALSRIIYANQFGYRPGSGEQTAWVLGGIEAFLKGDTWQKE